MDTSYCILAPTSATDGTLGITLGDVSSSGALEFTLSASVYGEIGYTASLSSADSNYIVNLFGTSP